MRRLVAMLVAAIGATLLAQPARSAAAPGAVSYRPPVDAPVSDPYRPPAERWSAGNRGLEYATEPGTPVHAAADGEVVFAGMVAGSLHVTLLHADGIRTSYSFLRSIAVERGERVVQGQLVGVAGDRLHFGARRGDDYIDPATLFGDGSPRAWLVPEEQRRPVGEAAERGFLARMLLAGPAPVGDAAATAIGWARRGVRPVAGAITANLLSGAGDGLDELRGLIHYGIVLNPCMEPIRLAGDVRNWLLQRQRCTPADAPAPRLTERRRVVLVAGLGSSTDNAAVRSVPTGRLGYAPADVVRYSYRGGTTADNPYQPADTEVDIRRSGRRLRELLERMEAESPGVPVDIIAHSQGGLVARSALGDEIDAADRRLPPLRTVVTLGTPHDGADLATAVAMVAHSGAGRMAERSLHPVLPDLDPQAASVRQLSETSGFLRRLNRRPLPRNVRFTAIGARGDLVVPAAHARLPGASNVTVSVPGLAHDHDGLPGSAGAEREMALAVSGLPPTCQTFVDSLADSYVSDRISRTEDALGAALWLGGRALSPPFWNPRGRPTAAAKPVTPAARSRPSERSHP